MTQGDRQQILAAVERLSAEAYRTLGQAYRPLGTASLAAVPGVRINAAGHVADIAAQRLITLSETLISGKTPELYSDGPCSKAEILKNNWYK